MKILVSLILLFTTLVIEARAQLPLYEVGIAYGMGVTPDYPGSEQSRLRYLAIPTFFYRGTTFRRDQEEGTRARFLKNENLSFDFSFSGSFPANSKDNDARAGMVDLDWLGEIGPRLQWIKNIKNEYLIRVAVPIRGVFSTDFSYTKIIGTNFNPSLRVRKNNCPTEKIQCFIGIDSTWMSGEVSDYFYSVTQKDATATRPLYNARSGYLGTDLSMAFAYRMDRTFFLFSGLSYSFYEQSKNLESPLFKAKNGYSIFVGFSWFFYQSKENEIKQNDFEHRL